MVNIALHLANTILVFCLLRKTVPAALERPWLAAFGAALFLLHPAQTDAVTYVSGRATSLMTFWLLVAHLAALRSLEGHSRRWTAISMAAFVLAVASKEIALAYPVMLIGWRMAGDRQSLRASAKAALPHLLATAGIVLVMVVHPGYRQLLGEVADSGRSAASPISHFEERLGLGFCFNYGLPRTASCVAARVEGLAGLARVLVFPWNVSIDPGRRDVSPADLLIVLVLGGTALAAWRSSGSVAAGAAWIIAALLPTHLLVVRSEPVADRLLYLPMVGFALITAAAAGRFQAWVARRHLAVAGVVALLSLAVLTAVRNTQYLSEVAVWEDAVRKAPRNPRAHVNLGYAYELSRDLDRAEKEYKASLALQPGLWWAEEGLRTIQARQDGTREGR